VRPCLVLAVTAAVLALLANAGPVAARSLEDVKSSGVLGLCAHPNALPFASKDGKRHGFQVDLAEALAKELGVSLNRDWVITRYDLFRTQCDIVMDSIADVQAQAESGLQLSKPYRRSAVALAVRGNEPDIRSLDDLRGHRQVGVLASSIAAMTLDQKGIETVPALFEDEMLEMLAKGEIDAAAVTESSAGYYNLRHPKAKLRLLYVFDGEPNLAWNVAVGMRRPDDELRRAVDAALDHLIADGTVKRIYASYGIELIPPR
jgi:polar amino acid transport system substrate-binding protein